MNIKKIILKEIDDFEWAKEYTGEYQVTSSYELNVGDRIKVTGSFEDIYAMGETGTVVEKRTNGYEMLIAFNSIFNDLLHQGEGQAECVNGNCYYFDLDPPNDLEIIKYM